MSVPSPKEPHLVDARGHRCPVPTLRLARALKAVKSGETVLLLSDDPLARVDIPHYAAAQGHSVLSLLVEDDVLRALVARGD
jgi:tRNA 2-thiouridine synthesizing protein A